MKIDKLIRRLRHYACGMQGMCEHILTTKE